MSYTIVYDRLFIRAADRYIPMCLYGCNNVTEYVNGRWVRERSWKLFSYCDEMILADKVTLMFEVRCRHTGECSQSFKFGSRWLDDAAVVRFYENGIKNAVTIEEIKEQNHSGVLHCYLSCWSKDLRETTTFEEYLRTSEDLIKWITEAKGKKAKMLSSEEWSSIYICCGFSGREPMRVTSLSKETGPVIAKDGKHGYVSSIGSDKSGWSSSPDIEKALVFANAVEAYDRLPDATFSIIPARRKRNAVNKVWVLSACLSDRVVYIDHLTQKKCKYVFEATKAEKRFASKKDALKWYEEKIHTRYPALTDPVAVNLLES